MKIRLITGTCYIAVLLVFFLLKIFVGDLFFDALIYAFALIGTFEMTRAMKERITKAEKIVVFVFSALCVPVCALFEEFCGAGLEGAAICFFVLTVTLLSLLVSRHDETSPENLGVAFLCAVYPNLLLVVLTLANHLGGGESLSQFALNSDLAILFVFVISPFADSLAYVFGRFLKGKFPKKMAPVLSPNKTVVGGIGGLIGGLIGAAILYFSYNAVAGSFENPGLWLPVYLLVGLLAAAATEFGDLVESCIKRKADIKDMGRLMPGHGGILDRIDGTLFAAVAVYVVFAAIHLIA